MYESLLRPLFCLLTTQVEIRGHFPSIKWLSRYLTMGTWKRRPRSWRLHQLMIQFREIDHYSVFYSRFTTLCQTVWPMFAIVNPREINSTENQWKHGDNPECTIGMVSLLFCAADPSIKIRFKRFPLFWRELSGLFCIFDHVNIKHNAGVESTNKTLYLHHLLIVFGNVMNYNLWSFIYFLKINKVYS